MKARYFDDFKEIVSYLTFRLFFFINQNVNACLYVHPEKVNKFSKISLYDLRRKLEFQLDPALKKHKL